MRVTIRDLQLMKDQGEKIAMITAYDYTSARIVEEAGIPAILVGDSMGQVVLGYDSTVPVTMADIIHHLKPVVRGTKTAHIVADMPFMSFQADESEAVRNAGRLLKEGGAQSVKLEGGTKIAGAVQRITDTGVPVMGHIGLTPQSVNQFGGYRVQGKTAKAALELFEDARALEEAGVYAVVLETVPTPLAKMITERLSIPTIGIGAGPHCDGQIQVFHDLLGLYTDFVPRHTRRYADLADFIGRATTEYIGDVRAQTFPTDEHGFSMDQGVLDEIAGKAGSSTTS